MLKCKIYILEVQNEETRSTGYQMINLLIEIFTEFGK